MIIIQNLNKIYKSKRREKCRALNDISLTLPDNGLVFVLGKSGSGKSTLLNLIGGLDSVTGGSIEVDGNDLAKFNEKQFCDYRNSHIGFIFQDYHLIDELTVYENIRLSLDLGDCDNTPLIDEALARVDLAGYGARFPSELSGGEQQRVAIARAIVKKPRIILADEPTGNLDTHTATAIITLLKQLSKECLILIVSHNVNDANAYADRIIELKKGQIISDKSRNPEFLDEVSLQNGELVYPQGLALSDADICFINQNKSADLVKRTDKYVVLPPPVHTVHKYTPIEHKSLRFTREMSLSGKFLKNKAVAIALSAFMVAVIMVIMALAQTIMAFDGGKIIADEMDKMGCDSVYTLKTTDEETKALLGDNARDYFAEISDSDIQKFYDNGYNGKIYGIYNFFMPIISGSNTISAGWSSSFFTTTVYPRAILGVIETDEEFLTDKFGEIEYLARVDEFHPGGIIITDYIADAIRLYNNPYIGKSYEALLGDYQWGTMHSPRGYINAIIKTDYQEKYGEFFEGLSVAGTVNVSELMENEEFLCMLNDVYSSYGLAYTFEQDFEESFENNYTCAFIWHHKLYFDDKEYFTTTGVQIRHDYRYGVELEDDEIMMNYSAYNEIFGTDYQLNTVNEFEPHEVTIRQYRYDDVENKNKLLEIKVKVVGLTAVQAADFSFIASEEVFNAFAQSSTFVTGLYFHGNENIDIVIDTANELGLTLYNSMTEGIHTMTKAVDVFVPIFELIAIFLCVGVVFILMNFSSKMINGKMHEIGILKALGAKNSSIGVVFGLQVALIAILTCILATAGYYFFIDLANTVLIESIKRLAPSYIIMDLKFLTFQPVIALINAAVVALLSVISLVVPMIKIKAIKPVSIIKAKE